MVLKSNRSVDMCFECEIAVSMSVAVSDEVVVMVAVVVIVALLSRKCCSLCGVRNGGWLCFVFCVLTGDLHATSCNCEVFTDVI